MSVAAAASPGKAGGKRPPPAKRRSGIIDGIRKSLFSSPSSTVLTLLCIWALVLIIPDLVSWGLLRAVWYSPDAKACGEPGVGACWALVPEKYRLILFGTYPYDEHWRAALASALIIGMTALSGVRRLWSPALLVVWVAVMALALGLLRGGILGLTPVDTREWSGLPLTLILFVGSVLGGIPLAILLALGRQSNLPAISALCTGVIELVRGVPLVSVLFMVSLMLPLFLPDGMTIDKLVRAGLGMTVFFAAYSAEVVRGGLQAIPRGQYEAADAMNLGYWTRTRRIVLPQALRVVLPALVSDVVRGFKNTTFVSIIGLYDILGTTRSAINDPVWVRYSIEGYLFIFAIYFVACYAMSQYSRHIEKRVSLRRTS